MKHGSILNGIMADGKNLTPEIGMGATHFMWSDRQAYTIIEIKSPTRIVVQRDIVKRSDDNGMSDAQSYEYIRDEEGYTRTLTLRKNGKWISQGESIKGTSFGIGFRKEYHDFSF